MTIINKILSVPFLWQISQWIFGCDHIKRKVYRDAIKGKGRLLDFGCANGNTFPAFTDFDYYGVDLDQKLIEYAQKKYARFKSAHFINADILKKPFESQFFDYILFAMIGHHLPDKPLIDILHVLADSLKTGGRFFYFDTIRDPKRNYWLLNTLINLDQGKDMRYETEYDTLLKDFPKELRIRQRKTFVVSGSLLPQPTYFYIEFEKE